MRRHLSRSRSGPGEAEERTDAPPELQAEEAAGAANAPTTSQPEARARAQRSRREKRA